MAVIEIPDLDPRDEDDLTASAIDALPAEISDRNDSAFAVAVIEACGTFYGQLVYYLNQLPDKLRLYCLKLLGITRLDAVAATVTLTFTATGAGATIPAGTIVKTGAGADAVEFTTDSELILAASASDDVTATASVAGSAGNVGANTLDTLDTPVSGVDSVTNSSSATGGTDLETLAAMEARAPLTIRAGERAITDEDFETHAVAASSSVIRANAQGDGSGSVAVALIADDLNERYTGDPTNVTDAAIRTAVKTDLEARTIPGVVVTPTQYAPRLVVLWDVEIELASGYTASTVAANIEATLDALVTAQTIYAADGVTVSSDAWPWGSPLYLNEVVAAIDGTAGVTRVGAITYKTSDDFGSTWSSETAWSVGTPIQAGRDGNDDTTLGMLHHDTSKYSGYAMTITEL